MSTSTCPYDVGAPSTWLSGIDSTRKACAVPLGPSCGDNQQILSTCCTAAVDSYNTTTGLQAYIAGSYATCALPADAGNATYQTYQDCILNAPGRAGGFRCTDPDALNKGANCNSLTGAIGPPVHPDVGEQACVTGAVANSSGVMQRCCGSAAVSFEGGCWQYCVAPADRDVGRCIQDGLRAANLSNGYVGCLNGSRLESGADTGAGVRVEGDVASTLGLVLLVAWMVGLVY